MSDEESRRKADDAPAAQREARPEEAEDVQAGAAAGHGPEGAAGTPKGANADEPQSLTMHHIASDG